MKKLAAISLSALMLAACSGNKSSEESGPDALAASRDSLQQVIADQDSLLALMSEISQGMDQIKAMENILSSPTSLKGETADQRQKIRDDMVAIQRSLNERRQRLAELESRLNQSNTNNANLRRAIDALKSQIAEQTSTIESLRSELAAANIHIDQLTQNVDSLNTTVATTVAELQQAQQETQQANDEMNTCYYAIGTKGELKSHNIIESGFLRKTTIMPGDFDQNYFTRADKRTLVNLSIHSKKAKVLTSQPASSYEFIQDGNGNKVLHIIDSAAFWRAGNYLVVQAD